jgi:endogenous inhibitor of DNA gyrase (YacG/DUF329 family)
LKFQPPRDTVGSLQGSHLLLAYRSLMPPKPSVKRVRCPYCSKEFEFTTVAAHKPFPFCSERCRDIDMGKWFMGSYNIPGSEGSAYDPENEEMSPDRDAT